MSGCWEKILDSPTSMLHDSTLQVRFVGNIFVHVNYVKLHTAKHVTLFYYVFGICFSVNKFWDLISHEIYLNIVITYL